MVARDEWRRQIFLVLHNGIQSNERVLLQIGTASVALILPAIVLMLAPDRDLGLLSKYEYKSIYFIILSILSAIMIHNLLQRAKNIQGYFKRLLKLESIAGVYETNELVSGAFYPKPLRKSADKLPGMFWTLASILMAATIVSIILSVLYFRLSIIAHYPTPTHAPAPAVMTLNIVATEFTVLPIDGQDCQGNNCSPEIDGKHIASLLDELCTTKHAVNLYLGTDSYINVEFECPRKNK